ncbi:MAG: hypothetical protein K6T30_00225 [Alicyclobacillus sp.]|nr:hypothetical protein [Alicyclobacillus sp.]
MPLWVDGVPADDSDGLAEALRRQVEAVRLSNRFVLSVLVNGCEQRIDELGNVSFSADDVVQLQTGTLDELVEGTMESVSEYTPRLMACLERAVDHWDAGRHEEGFQGFAQTVEGLQWTAGILQSLCAMHPGPSELHEVLGRLQDVTPVLLSALETGNVVLASNLVRYELLPVLTRWYHVSQLFRQQMALARVRPASAT